MWKKKLFDNEGDAEIALRRKPENNKHQIPVRPRRCSIAALDVFALIWQERSSEAGRGEHRIGKNSRVNAASPGMRCWWLRGLTTEAVSSHPPWAYKPQEKGGIRKVQRRKRSERSWFAAAQ
jgi:hypothetical protein